MMAKDCEETGIEGKPLLTVATFGLRCKLQVHSELSEADKTSLTKATPGLR